MGKSVKEEEGEKTHKLDWKDYLAIIIAMLTTNLLPIIAIIAILVIIVLITRLFI